MKGWRGARDGNTETNEEATATNQVKHDGGYQGTDSAGGEQWGLNTS